MATFVPVSPIARPRKRLFARLFNVDGRDSPDRLHEIRVGIREQRETRPRILCGMTVIEVTPDVDPTMVVPLPEDGPRFSARRIRPSICVR